MKGWGVLLYDKKYKAYQKGHRLTDCRGYGGPHHSPGKHPYKQIIQNNVCDKAGHHSSHSGDRPSHIANERNQSGSRNLKDRPVADKAQILTTVLQYLTACTKYSKNLGTGKQEQDGKENAASAQQDNGHAHVLFSPAFMLTSCMNRVLNRAAHADACPNSLQKSRQRKGNVDRGQGIVSQRVSYKEAIGNRIDSRQGKGKHRRDYISKKFSSDVHFNPRPP